MTPRSSGLTFEVATDDDAPALAALQQAVARHLTHQFGRGHWSTEVTEKGTRRRIAASRVLVARQGPEIVATAELTTRKPWAIDVRRFSPVTRPLYLRDMAVTPVLQRQGLGRRLLAEAIRVARTWPGDAIRLDAYDGPAGAGMFYAGCGFREVGGATYRGTPLIYFERHLTGSETS